MVKICVTGCLHGELDRVYADVAAAERRGQFRTDLLLCCGDFQSLRNPSDLASMSVPPKYYAMGDFWRYYAEEVRAPILTLFIGGNHEASGYLQELPYGGWVAPNIWYMGYAGVVQFAGLRIAGLSGIYKQHDYTMGHYEHPPYSEATKRSVYHLRNLEVFRLGQVRRRLDIVLSHDWPRGIYHYGDTQTLIGQKRHFRDEIDTDTLGSPPAEQLFCRLRPRYWFSAHLHCKFSAVVEHTDYTSSQKRITRFLALDKCLPRRDYLQFFDIEPESVPDSLNRSGDLNTSDSLQSSVEDDDDPFIVSSVPRPPEFQPDEFSTRDDDADGDGDGNAPNGSVSVVDEEREKSEDQPTGLYLDPEWLCILRATNHLMSTNKVPCILPTPETEERCDFSATSDEIRALYEPFGNQFAVPDNFERTAPAYKPNDAANTLSTGHVATSTPQSLAQQASLGSRSQQLFSNPQTELICAMLDLVNPNALLLGRESYSLMELSSQLEAKRAGEADEPDEDLDDEVNTDDEADELVPNPSELDGTEPLGGPTENSSHADSGQTDSNWVSAHAEYDPLHSIASSPSHADLQPQSPPESASAVNRLSVSHNPEEVNLDELEDEDDDVDEQEVEEGETFSEASLSAVYTTEAYSPQPLDSSYATGMAQSAYQPPIIRLTESGETEAASGIVCSSSVNNAIRPAV